MATGTQILLISGSTRHGSTNTAALRTAERIAPDAVTTVRYDGLDKLPAFNPDDDHDPLHPAVADLRQRIAGADAVLLCTPEYAGALPGAFKNLLDWTVGGSQMYRKPTAWINVAAPGRGLGAHDSLATVLGYLDAAIIEPACRSIPVARETVGDDGLITDSATREQIAGVLSAIADHTRRQRVP
ncbi:NADPH-dependent FMN reductase [Amycolatopsis alkalitolerans]|uniref:NADPH-dependent FMN reductase n=1 Tax=Amycolatopsis alkalitolerans TaxID=2547244 RepID=UPI00190F9BD0|nr:NAD(P)H-dependent oxidoreductase [Amycolatopsis alkalitolerans]